MLKHIFILSLALGTSFVLGIENNKMVVTTKPPEMSTMSSDRGAEAMAEQPPFFQTNYTNTFCHLNFMIDLSTMEALEQSGSFADETDRTPKCFIKCILEMSGVDKGDGTYNPEVATMLFAGNMGKEEMDQVGEVTKLCLEGREETCKCERAYQYVKCIQEKRIQMMGIVMNSSQAQEN